MFKRIILVMLIIGYSFSMTHAKNEINHFVKVYPKNIWAPSYLGQDSFKVLANYHPYYIIDGDDKTAWVEGVPGDGIGERLYLYFQDLNVQKCLYFRVKNGYQKSPTLFAQNNRIKEIRITIAKDFRDRYRQIHILEDKLGWQEIKIEGPFDFNKITIEILSVYEGEKYDDTCISEIEICIDDSPSTNQNEIKEKYDKWFEERQKESEFFRNLPHHYPFKEYKRTTYEAIILVGKKINWETINESLRGTEWEQLIESETWEKVLPLTKPKKNTTLVKHISFNVDTYQPEVLKETSIDFAKHLYIDKIDIVVKDKGEIYEIDNLQDVYDIQYHGSGVFELSHLHFVDEPSDGYTHEVNSYFYNGEGKLIYVQGDKIADDGELYNEFIIVWAQDKVEKIYWLYGQDEWDFVKLRLTVYK